MFKKGNRMLAITNLILLLVAGLHTYGSLISPNDEKGLQVIETMKNFSFSSTGLSWNTYDVLISVMLAMTLFLVFIAVLNFYLIYSSAASSARKHIILIDTIFMWLLTFLYGYFQVAPPFLSFILLSILFTITYFIAVKTSKV